MSLSRLSLLLALLILVSCKKKELPKPTTGSPLFYFKGTINSVPLDINAGVNNYYLFTTYALSGNNIYLLNGKLSDLNCTNDCRSVLAISIADYKRRNGAGIDDISTVLKNTSYKYYISDPILDDTTKIFQFTAASGYQSYSWDFGDGTTSAQQNPKHTFAKPITYNVCLTIDNGDGCIKTMCNWVNAGTKPAEDLTFNYAISEDTIKLNAPAGWNSYFWSLSDSSIGSTNNVIHLYKEQGVYDVCLSATKTRSVKTFCRQIKIPGDFNCTADWSYTSTLSVKPVKDSLQSKIIIEWTDANGKKYNSSLNLQPPTSYFTIKNGNTYITNANNEKTYQFNCIFDVWVFDMENPSNGLHLNSSQCNWGVAYP